MRKYAAIGGVGYSCLGGTMTAPRLARKSAQSRRSCIRFAQLLCVFDQPKSAGIPLAKETIMLHELRHRFARWIAYRQTLARLRQASDSTLADAGISREEIRARARHASLRR